MFELSKKIVYAHIIRRQPQITLLSLHIRVYRDVRWLISTFSTVSASVYLNAWSPDNTEQHKM